MVCTTDSASDQRERTGDERESAATDSQHSVTATGPATQSAGQ